MDPAIQEVLLAGPAARIGKRHWYRIPSLLAGLAILAVIVGLALAAPLITSYDPTEQFVGIPLEGPSSEHWLGTDQLGRDVFSRLVYAARIDLFIGVAAVLTPFILGTLLGSLAGYYGKTVDTVVTAAVDVVQAFPYYVLILALVFVFGAGIRSILVAVAMVAWVSYARIIRGEVLSAREQEYVLAARAAGLSDRRILFRHIFPNVMTQPIIYMMADIVVIIVGVVMLSFFGLGVPPPAPDWGSMIAPPDGNDTRSVTK